MAAGEVTVLHVESVKSVAAEEVEPEPAQERRRSRRRLERRERDGVRRLPDRRGRGRGALALGRNGRGVLADWMIMAGAVLLFGSLFLTWSHQLSPSLLARFGASAALRGVPRDPTAWQVYSIADVLLAMLAAALAVIAAAGGRTARLTVSGAAAIALAFVLHATSTPPTNGASLANSATTPASYFPNSPTAGAGSSLAALAVVVALAGLVLSFTAD
jgi:hypothetical protein